MGNSSSKDGRPPSRHHGHTAGSGQSSQHVSAHDQRLANQIYGNHSHSSSGRRGGSQSNLGFLSLGGSSNRDHNDHPAPERPRETKPEREARRAERERQARLKERERSMREESVDGGYLVTLGVYTGVEDFNKAVVRQLQIERRLAPFWRGLNDHASSWTEAQLFAAARGLPIPAPDEVPPEMERTASQLSTTEGTQSLMVPIATPGGRTFSQQSDNTSNLSASHPAFSTSGPPSPSPAAAAAASSTSPLFRGRAKTLASLASGGNRQSPSPDLTPQEIRLPADPYVNGTRLEAVLYKDASECPICFMYYPPYLNRTRCCAQDICSECFVQIKRPDPHPPEHEHHSPDDQSPRPPPTEDQQLLVSEVAACPFCVTPEFGVTYDPPPFRRGLAYAAGTGLSHSAIGASAMSSSSSLAPPPASGTAGPPTSRRRTTSLSASAPNVITTDRVRPDWAKKLADARAHALRRSAAATALHNAAYVLGNVEGSSSRSGGLRLGRRRTLFIENHLNGSGGSGSSTPRDGHGTGSADGDLAGARGSSRRHHGAGGGQQVVVHPRVEDLEELMMMEAIRLSLAAEEERKKKEEKEKSKEAKQKAKEAEKEAKKAAKKGGPFSGGGSGPAAGAAGVGASLSTVGSQVSVATYGSGQMGSPSGGSPTAGTSAASGKGKQAVLQNDEEATSRQHARQLSSASSIASSILEPVSTTGNSIASGTAAAATDGNGQETFTTSTVNGTAAASTTATSADRETSPLEFSSLAAIVDHEEPQFQSDTATTPPAPPTTTTTLPASSGDEKLPTIKTVESVSPAVSAEEGQVADGEKQGGGEKEVVAAAAATSTS